MGVNCAFHSNIRALSWLQHLHLPTKPKYMHSYLQALCREIDQIKSEISMGPDIAHRHGQQEIAALKYLSATLAERLAQLEWALANADIQTTEAPVEEAVSNAEDEALAPQSEEIDTQKMPLADATTPPSENQINAASLSERLQRQPIADLRRAFGLNERFFYTNELFDGDGEEFGRAINEFNHLANFEDAQKLVAAKYSDRYHWSEEDENVQRFLAIVERRYL